MSDPRAARQPNPLAKWTAKRDGDAVEFRMVPAPKRRRSKGAFVLAPSIRAMHLELRYPEGPGDWQTISRVADADEAEYVLDLFYGDLFMEIERV